MKIGQIVKIYEDPITEQKLEGKAKLTKRLKLTNAINAKEQLEYWLVAFQNDDYEAKCWIKTTS